MDHITVWRILVLPEALAPVDEGRLLSASWTQDPSDLSVDSLLVPDEADDSWVDVAIEAHVACIHVDWAATEARRAEIPWEKEMLLLPEAVLDIAAVWRWDSARMEKGNKIEGHPLEGRRIASSASLPRI